MSSTSWTQRLRRALGLASLCAYYGVNAHLLTQEAALHSAARCCVQPVGFAPRVVVADVDEHQLRETPERSRWRMTAFDTCTVCSGQCRRWEDPGARTSSGIHRRAA